MALDLDTLQSEAEQYAKDLTQPGTSGGGDFTPPPKGPAALRLAGYIEVGIHTTNWQGNKKTKPRALLVFELSGKNHAPRELEDGTLIPYRIEVKEVVGFHEKNNYLKLFQQITPEYPEAKHYVHLLKKAELRGTVVHTEKEYNGKKVTFAGLRGKTGYTIFPASFEDQETGETRRVKPGPLVSEVRAFLWDSPTLDQWDSLFIDGTYDDGGSKNKYQEKIKAAENWVGSPMYNLLIESGRGEEVNPAPKGTGSGEPEDDGEEDAPATPAKDKGKKAAPVADPLAGEPENPDDPSVGADPEPEVDEEAELEKKLAEAKAKKAAAAKAAAKAPSKPVAAPKPETKAKVATTPPKASTARKSAPAASGDPLADFE